MADTAYVYSVSELNREARLLLGEHFGVIWVQGEISNLAMPGSGHFYFSLKDAEAQVRCAMFRAQNRHLSFQPRNGDQVLARAQVGLYEPRGEYQLIVEFLEEAGDGALRRAFEVLKQRLAAEGLFDTAHKRPIPALPQCIGLITSPTGAAVHDVLTVLRRRFPAIPVLLFPVKVQGSEAKFEIARAVELADQLKLCDVLILARGGGSLEDLWAFNEESVARAIFRCQTPIVTGIGHEVDFTIADLVADLRAPTPSAAAEAVSPDGAVWLARFERKERELTQRVRAGLESRRQRLAFLAKRLENAHPRKRVQTQQQRLDELEPRLRRAWFNRVRQHEARVENVGHRLLRYHPGPVVRAYQARGENLRRRLLGALRQDLERQRTRLQSAAEHLNNLGPAATLKRGYALVTRQRDGKPVRDWRDVSRGEALLTRLEHARIVSLVEESRPADDGSS